MRSKISGALKFIAALAIPVGIYSFWNYSQKQADVQVEEYQKMQKEHPDTDNITVDNYELKEVDDNDQVRWQLLAKQGIMEPVSKNVALNTVQVSYFDDKKLKMRISAPTGMANEVTHIVKLDAVQGNRVLAEGEDGKAKMDATKVELTKKNQFIATGGVNIVWPGVAKGERQHGRRLLRKKCRAEEF